MIVAVTGTGTGIGKTTLATAMVRVLRPRFAVGGWKPIETGGDEDGRALGAAAGSDESAWSPRATAVELSDDGARVDLAPGSWTRVTLVA